MGTELLPYDRLDGESSKAYKAFCVYRDLGPQRSLREAYRRGSGVEQASRASGAWEGWYARFEWKRRAEAFDADRERKARADKQRVYQKELEEFRQRLRGLNGVATDLATGLLILCGEKIAALKAEHIPIDCLPNFMRAAAAIAQASIDAEGAALGVEEVLRALSEPEGEERSGSSSP